MSTTPKSNRTTHTPSPWTVSQWHEPRGGVSPCIMSRGATVAILHVAPITQQPEAEANAEFIVRACNSHEELIAVISGIVDRAGKRSTLTLSTVDIAELRAVLAKASGAGH